MLDFRQSPAGAPQWSSPGHLSSFTFTISEHGGLFVPLAHYPPRLRQDPESSTDEFRTLDDAIIWCAEQDTHHRRRDWPP